MDGAAFNCPLNVREVAACELGGDALKARERPRILRDHAFKYDWVIVSIG